MPEYLNETAWKNELKKHPNVKDTGLSEPLRKYAQLENKNDGPSKVKREQVLNKIILMAKAARKVHSKNEKLLAYLGDLLDEAKKELGKLELELGKEDKEEDDKKPGKDNVEDEDNKLRARLKQAKTQRMYFLFGPGGRNLLIVKASKPGPKELKKLTLAGAEKVYRGICLGEGSTMVFYFNKNPSGALKSKIKQAIQEQAGLALKIDCRHLEGLRQMKGLQRGVGDSDGLERNFEMAESAWSKVTGTLENRLTNLKLALLKTNDERAIQVAKQVEGLVGGLANVRSHIFDLCQFDSNADQSGLIPLQKNLKNAIAECKNYLTTPQVALVDKNPFAKVEFSKLVKLGLSYAEKYCVKQKIKV